jgi:hypothetical protein
MPSLLVLWSTRSLFIVLADRITYRLSHLSVEYRKEGLNEAVRSVDRVWILFFERYVVCSWIITQMISISY